MYKKVIWATDGSANADRAMAYAKTLASESGSPLLVVYCKEIGGPFPLRIDEDEVQAKVKRQVAELSSNGTTAALEMLPVKIGGAAHTIAEIGKREQADLIVVGTRGQTPLTGLLLGSVTQRLLHIAPCPVLAVPPAHPRT